MVVNADWNEQRYDRAKIARRLISNQQRLRIHMTFWRICFIVRSKA